MNKLEFQLYSALRAAQSYINGLEQKPSLIGDYVKKRIDEAVHSGATYTETCPKCGGHQVLADGDPCRLCNAEGEIPSPNLLTAPECKMKIMASHIDKLLDSIESKISQTSLPISELLEYVNMARWAEHNLDRKDHMCEIVQRELNAMKIK